MQFTLVLVSKMLRILGHRVFEEDTFTLQPLYPREKEADILYDRKPVRPEMSLDHPTPEQQSPQKYNAKLTLQKTTVASHVAL
jgi:hypothetical protein